ncbi:MAG: glycosyltransferase family 39 protein [Bacteroidia bacterium]|nr:glycosyltransferase family 39 protein [Bacteroidia bacterium]
MPRRSLIRDFSLLALICATGFTLFLGAPPLFDWDEINFAEAAREMMVTGNYLQVQINYQAFFEKPPLFFWLQTLCMQVFGVNEFAARFPNVLAGIFTLLALYWNGLHFRDEKFARLLAGFYLASLLPVIYFKSGIIDPVFNFFIFLGLMQILRHDLLRKDDKTQAAADSGPWAAGFWIGLATLTKGPVALLVTILIYGFFKLITDRFRIPVWAFLKFLSAWFIVIMGWYGLETVAHGPEFIQNFIRYQIGLFGQDIAGHAQPFYYHFLVFLPGCFPLSAFAFRGMALKPEMPKEKLLHRFMLIWFWVIMILFSLVKTKIVHYSSLLYFPGAFLAAFFFSELIAGKKRITWDIWLILIIGLLVWGIAPVLINYAASHTVEITSMIKDPFARANLSMEVEWGGFEWMVGAVFLIGLLVNFYLLIRQRWLPFLYIQVFLTLFFVNGQFGFTVPKVARYTQGAPLDFFSGLAGKDVYVMTYGYKSYLPYFYAKAKPSATEESTNITWLTEGEIDKDVFLAVKVHRENEAFRQRFRNFERLYELAGFAFYRRRSNVVYRAENTR